MVATSENARAIFAKSTSRNPSVAERAEGSKPDPGRGVPGKTTQKPNCAINPAPGQEKEREVVHVSTELAENQIPIIAPQ
eukprot:8570089-Pyramimonas_sp.AAC.1